MARAYFDILRVGGSLYWYWSLFWENVDKHHALHWNRFRKMFLISNLMVNFMVDMFHSCCDAAEIAYHYNAFHMEAQVTIFKWRYVRAWLCWCLRTFFATCALWLVCLCRRVRRTWRFAYRLPICGRRVLGGASQHLLTTGASEHVIQRSRAIARNLERFLLWPWCTGYQCCSRAVTFQWILHTFCQHRALPSRLHCEDWCTTLDRVAVHWEATWVGVGLSRSRWMSHVAYPLSMSPLFGKHRPEASRCSYFACRWLAMYSRTARC